MARRDCLPNATHHVPVLWSSVKRAQSEPVPAGLVSISPWRFKARESSASANDAPPTHYTYRLFNPGLCLAQPRTTISQLLSEGGYPGGLTAGSDPRAEVRLYSVQVFLGTMPRLKAQYEMMSRISFLRKREMVKSILGGRHITSSQ